MVSLRLARASDPQLALPRRCRTFNMCLAARGMAMGDRLRVVRLTDSNDAKRRHFESFRP